MEKALHTIRIQNIPEGKKEDLLEIVCQPLAQVLEIETDEMRKEIDEITRIGTPITRKNKLPREIHVKLCRKQMRDQLLFKANSKLRIKDQEVMVLKDIPWKMRNRRKNYSKLVNLLKENGIMFKWLVPEGVLFYFKGTRFNINSTFKMEQFIKSNKDLVPTKQRRKDLEELLDGNGDLTTEESSSEEDEEEDLGEEEEKEKKLLNLEASKKDKDSDRELIPRVHKPKNGN